MLVNLFVLQTSGEVAEWPKALDSKSSRLQNSLVSSNLTLSAIFWAHATAGAVAIPQECRVDVLNRFIY
jgi:hypothetical protein